MTPRPMDGLAEIFNFESVELSERKDLLDLLANLIGPAVAGFLVMFWVPAACKRAQQ